MGVADNNTDEQMKLSRALEHRAGTPLQPGETWKVPWRAKPYAGNYFADWLEREERQRGLMLCCVTMRTFQDASEAPGNQARQGFSTGGRWEPQKAAGPKKGSHNREYIPT